MEVGSLDLSVSWPDWEPQIIASGAGIGFSEEELRPDTSLILAGYSQDGVLLYPYLEFDSMQAMSGSIELDQESAFGAIYYTTEEMGYRFEQAGFIHGGTLSFDAFGIEEGDSVVGTLRSDIYAWQEITE